MNFFKFSAFLDSQSKFQTTRIFYFITDLLIGMDDNLKQYKKK